MFTSEIAALAKRTTVRLPLVGSLEDMPFPTLLQTLEMNRRTGELKVYIGDRVHGRIWVRDGELIDAQCGVATGEEATYRMLVLEGGQFRVDFESFQRARTITASTQGLLLEGMRRLDHMHRLSAGLPRLDSYCHNVRQRAPARGPARQIFDAATDPVTLRELIDGQPDGLAALETVSELFTQGALVESAYTADGPTFEELCTSDSMPIVVRPEGVPQSRAPKRRRFGRLIVGALSVAAVASGGVVMMTGGSTPSAPVEESAPTQAVSPAVSVAGAPASSACPDGMAYVKAGAFQMGTDSMRGELADALPPHPVELSAYCLDERQVSTGEYQSCSGRGQCLRAFQEPVWPRTSARANGNTAGEAPSCAEAGDDGEAAVNCVTQQQAADFCAWRGRRLLTEAEWEHVARLRGGLAVAGIVDGLAEWTADHPYPYSSKSVQDPRGPAAGRAVVVRGAALSDRTVDPAYRYYVATDVRLPTVGFRCAADPS